MALRDSKERGEWMDSLEKEVSDCQRGGSNMIGLLHGWI